MKKYIAILLTFLTAATSCTRFDDSAIWEELLDHRERIEKLEAECNRLNSNVEALQAILGALQTNDYVTDVVKVVENGVEVGYCITFAKGGKVTIYHGASGEAGTTPKVGIQKAADGQYYWTVDGEWMTDDEGEKIPAAVTATDGKYITPQFRIAEGVWYISYDNGNSWIEFRQAEEDGVAASFFLSVTYDESEMSFVLSDGTVIKVPRLYSGDESKAFVALTNRDLALSGSASIDDDGVVTVGGGKSNRAYLSGGFQSNHFTMAAKVRVAEHSDFSFVIGKDNNNYGFYVDLHTTGGVSYLDIYKDQIGDFTAPKISNVLDFVLSPNKLYLIRLRFETIVDVNPQKLMTIEVIGEQNEYYMYETRANAYGSPFYYSDSEMCEVYEYNLSIQHYYDLKNAKVAVFGHSFVEGDSLGANRKQGFAYLLEDEMGKGLVINLGLGGDTITGMYNKICNSRKFISNCEYAFLCIGTNDRGLSYENYIAGLEKCISEIEKQGLVPILFTIPPANYAMTDTMLRENDWIRSSGHQYVDMYKVFADDAGNCKEELFLPDKIHPTVTGHLYILNRIKLDCPYLI